MSSPLPIHEQTTQSASDSADVVDFLERLKAHEPQPRCLLAGPDKHDHVELPPELFGILAQAAHALLDGKNVVIKQYDPFLTTQEAADYLGVSRSTVVRIVERGELPFTKVSRHRRIRFTDLQAFIEQEKERQINAIAQLLVLSTMKTFPMTSTRKYALKLRSRDVPEKAVCSVYRCT